MNPNRLGQLTLKLLPRTDVRLLRIVVVCMAMGSLWYAGHELMLTSFYDFHGP